jgi:hypothetical protein
MYHEETEMSVFDSVLLSMRVRHKKHPLSFRFFKGGTYHPLPSSMVIRELPLSGKEGKGRFWVAGLGNHTITLVNAALPILIALMLSLSTLGCVSKSPVASESEVAAVYEAKIPFTIEDETWRQSPVHSAKLLLQDMVEPRLMEASTSFVNVQAATDGQKIVFRLSWNDPTIDDMPGPGRFSDAVAVQLPAVTSADVPAPQMGEAGKPVEITYWSAIFQSQVNGRKDEIKAIYPRAKVDTYPFEAAPLKSGSPTQESMANRYSPARTLQNPMSGPRTVPVQDLIAEGPGTLRPRDASISTGVGKHSKDGWTVLLVRPLPNGAQPGGRTQVAFAVWEGSHSEAGPRKMRTAWIPLALGSAK